MGTKFEVGKEYELKTVKNDSRFVFTVIDRTAKFVTIRGKHFEDKKLKIYCDDDDNEICSLGLTFSTEPCLNSKKLK